MHTVREICHYFLGFQGLSPLQIQAKEESWGYKSRCVKLLAKLLGRSTSRIWHWGKGLDFDSIPAVLLAELNIHYLRAQLAEKDKALQLAQSQIRNQERTIERLQFPQEFKKSA